MLLKPFACILERGFFFPLTINLNIGYDWNIAIIYRDSINSEYSTSALFSVCLTKHCLRIQPLLSAENKLLLNYLTHQMVLGGSEIDQSTMTSLKVLGPLDQDLLSKMHSL